MNKLAVIFCTAALFSASHNAKAFSQFNNRIIDQIAVGEQMGGDVLIRLKDHDSISQPACATDPQWTMRFDGTTEAGKQLYSMALLAASAKAVVDIAGEDSCIGNIRKLRWLRLK